MKKMWKSFGIVFVAAMFFAVLLSAIPANMAILPTRTDEDGWKDIVLPVGTYTTVEGASFKLVVLEKGASLKLIEARHGLLGTKTVTTATATTGEELKGASVTLRPITLDYSEGVYWVKAKLKVRPSFLIRPISTTKLGEWTGMSAVGTYLWISPLTVLALTGYRLPANVPLDIMVKDIDTNVAISGATVELRLVDRSGKEWKGSATTDAYGKAKPSVYFPEGGGMLYETITKEGYETLSTTQNCYVQTDIIVYLNPVPVTRLLKVVTPPPTDEYWTCPDCGAKILKTDTNAITAHQSTHLQSNFQQQINQLLENQTRFLQDIINTYQAEQWESIEELARTYENTSKQYSETIKTLYTDVTNYISFNENRSDWMLGRLLNPQASVSLISQPVLYAGIPNTIMISPNYCKVTRVVVADRSGVIFESDADFDIVTTLSITPVDGEVVQINIYAEAGQNATSPTGEAVFLTSRIVMVSRIGGVTNGGVWDENLPFGMSTVDAMIILAVFFGVVAGVLIVWVRLRR